MFKHADVFMPDQRVRQVSSSGVKTASDPIGTVINGTADKILVRWRGSGTETWVSPSDLVSDDA